MCIEEERMMWLQLLSSLEVVIDTANAHKQEDLTVLYNLLDQPELVARFVKGNCHQATN